MSKSASISQLLMDAQLAIENGSENKEISGLLASYGYGVERMEEGRDLLAEFERLHLKQQAAYDTQREKTRIFNELLDSTKQELLKITAIGRIIERSGKLLGAVLSFPVRGKGSFCQWIDRAKSYMDALLSSDVILNEFGVYNISSEKLNTVQEKLVELSRANRIQEDAKGEAQQCTVDRKFAAQKLRKWMVHFRQMAKIALHEKPQYTEKLGIKQK